MSRGAVTSLARIRVADRISFAEVHDECLIELNAAPWHGGRPTERRLPRNGHVVLAPVEPTKIVCVGLNYAEHVAESQTVLSGANPPHEPLIFLKPPSAIIGPGQAIHYPAGVTRLDPEA